MPFFVKNYLQNPFFGYNINKGQRKSKIRTGSDKLARLSDVIEEFIKSLLKESEGQLELQRNELADFFECAPSPD